MLELGLKVLISYLAGSLNGSLILGWIRGVDIRTMGSGNAGGTNALRTLGVKSALLVMLIDIGKGFLPAALLPGLALPGVPLDPEISRNWLALACAGAAVVGHCYPVWFGFKGGKGAATAIGAIAAINVALLPAGAIAWFAVLVLTGYVGLATMTAAVTMAVYAWFAGDASQPDVFVFLVALAGFIIYTHRSNISRLLNGTENRMERAMLLRRSR